MESKPSHLGAEYGSQFTMPAWLRHTCAFDAAMRDLVLAHVPDGVVTSTITATVVWGRPEAGTGAGRVL